MSKTQPKKFAAFDIDGTIFRSGLAREVVYELIATDKAPKGLADAFMHHESAWKTRRASEAFHVYDRAMADAFNDMVTQIKCDDFDQAAKIVFERVSDYVYTYTRDLLRRLKKQGYTLIAISGSHEELVQPFAEKYGFDIWVAQKCHRGEDGYFTGEIILTHEGKDKYIRELVEKHGLDFRGSIAVGDTRGDISMLSIVDHPIAFNPERQLFDKAKQEGWQIVVERKNMTYELKPDGTAFVLA